MLIDEKDRQILRSIIDAYVDDGVPVSSQRVHDGGCQDMSTATIRNRMVVLEHDGYICKAHVSSGRIPTDAGYRERVNELQTDSAMPRGEHASAVRAELRQPAPDVNGVMMQATQLLGMMSNHVAVVYGSIVQESRVRLLRLFRLDTARVILAVHLVPEYEHVLTLRLDRDVSEESVRAAERLLQAMVINRPLGEAKRLLTESLRDNVTEEGAIVREVALRRDEIFSAPPAVELCVEERSRVLEQRELSDARTLQLLLRILHNRDYLASLLASRPLDRTEVTIGREHRDEALRPFSMVTAGYRMGASRGVLGIIGPTRMRYDVALSLVGAVSREMRAIGEEYF
ncbi:MAG TPA: heat-inducible transcriptional repressor HrcA [Candidatus Krumholzibacteria bacterium]